MGLYKRKNSPYWYMTFTDAEGKFYDKSTGTDDEKTAKKIWRMLKAKIALGTWHPEAMEKQKEKVSMTEVVDRYMKEVSPLKPGSHERDKQIIARFKAFFGAALLDEVDAPMVSRYKAERLQAPSKRGGNLSPDTVRKELGLLRTIFNVAIDEWELCEKNPVRKIIKSLPREEKRVRYVLPEEAVKLRVTLPAWLKPIVITACQTGLRRNNLVRLTVAQLDFDSNRIIIGKTKNGDPLGISMTSLVKETLSEVIRSRRVTSPYVFTDDKGEAYTPYKVSMTFKRACDRAGIKNLRLHDLRHDFATLMLRKTRNLVDVQHALGHKDSRMTMRYAHLLPEDLNDSFNAIDNQGTAAIL